MNYNARKKYILEKLEAEHIVKILELSQEMKVTRETVRRDLYQMEAEGLIKKVHGGAVLETPNQETAYDKRRDEFWQEKEKIAKLAVSYIEEGDSIYLDYGTTTFALAKEIAKLKNLTIVTNTLPIADMLIKNPTLEIIIPGGIVRKNEASLSGPFALNNLNDIFVTLGFFGISGIDLKAGLTSHNTDENLVSREMIQHSQTTIVLADHSKFGNVAFNKTADFNQLDVLITDKELPEQDRQIISSNGVNIIVPET